MVGRVAFVALSHSRLYTSQIKEEEEGGAGGSRNSGLETQASPIVLSISSGKAETFGTLLDGLEQHGAQLVVSLVRRQVQLVETSMR